MKRSIKLLFSLGCWICTCATGFGQIVTVTTPASGTFTPITISVPTGKVFECLTFINSNGTQMPLQLGGLTVAYSQSGVPSASSGYNGPKLAGPLTLTLPVNANGTILTYSLTDNAVASPQIDPSAGTAVVIPADATGPVQVILESSIDMVTWTAATPGSYGSSTDKRFFRVRAVNQ